MRQILELLASDCAFLYVQFGFRIIDSQYDTSFGGTGRVNLINKDVEFIFDLDRDQLFLLLRATGRTTLEFTFSFDLVRQLLTGEWGRAEMTAENIEFLEKHMEGILDLFTPSKVAATEAALKLREQQRLERWDKPCKTDPKLKSRPADETN